MLTKRMRHKVAKQYPELAERKRQEELRRQEELARIGDLYRLKQAQEYINEYYEYEKRRNAQRRRKAT